MKKIITSILCSLFISYTYAAEDIEKEDTPIAPGSTHFDVTNKINEDDYELSIYMFLDASESDATLAIGNSYIVNNPNVGVGTLGYTTILGDGTNSLIKKNSLNYTFLLIKASMLKTIKANAFKGMTGITTITIRTETPPELEEEAFPNDLKDIIVNVPKSSLDAYKKSDWGKFFTCLKDETATSISDIETNSIKLVGQKLVLNPEQYVEVYSITGNTIFNGNATAVMLPQKGIYFVRTNNNKAVKFICK